ncbi:hypothetical protein QYE76_062001 [Lolium multiflorum]|uniref:Uncharacterized protein n=1 Tax=Lolium multiflorum TaxID=4521 RepID=A0AAD8S1V4_LOLMU|nr:hypothetical protein QYE76_062001 [Lolium multiflorum]
MDQSRQLSEHERAALRQAQGALELKESAIADASRAIKLENYMLQLMTGVSQDMAGSFLDAVAEEQQVNSRVEVLLDLAKKNNIDFWADENRAHQIVQFQDRDAQVRKFQDFFSSTLAMVYNAMFPRNPQSANITELMDKFRNVESIHDFVKVQMVAGAKFALIWLKVCHSKLVFNNLFDLFYRKTSKIG